MDIADRFNVDLTRSGLAAAGADPIVAGDEWSLRFQLRDGVGAAVALTGATIRMTVIGDVEAENFTRTTGVLVGADLQVEPDADQAGEVLDPVTGASVSGKGWFTVRGSSEDEAALRAVAGVRDFDVRIRFATGELREFLRGKVEVLAALSYPMP